MKKLLTVLNLFVFISVASSQTVQENVHYKILDRPEKKNVVTEIYSVYCAFCYQYERNVIPQLKAILPKYVIYEEKHIKELGQYGDAATNLLATLINIDENLYQKVKSAYFQAIFIDKINFTSEKAFVDYGIAVAGIEKKTMGTINNKQTLQEWNDVYEIAKSYGTPSIVVNNKYIVLTKSIKSQTEFGNVVMYLLKK